MDKSNNYMNMCKKAEEIQKIWKHSMRSGGDFYYNKILAAVYAVTDNEQKDEDCIWLPRQDQLQDILAKKTTFLSIYGLLNGFQIYLVEVGQRDYIDTMEKLWLEYTMRTLFDKRLVVTQYGFQWLPRELGE